MACAFAVALSIGTTDAGAQVDVERKPARIEPPAVINGIDQVQGLPATVGPDKRSLWYHLQRGNIQMVTLELQRLQATHPDWSPQGDLARAIEDAMGAAELPGQTPADGLLDPCDDPAAAWRDARGSRAVLITMLVRCNDMGVAQGTLAELLRGRSLAAQLAQVEELASRRLSRAGRSVVMERRYHLRLEALDNPDIGLSPKQLEDLHREAEHRQDGAAALLFGWQALDRGMADEALTWFERARHWGQIQSAREGLALAQEQRARALILDAGDLPAGMEAIRASQWAGGAPAEAIGWALLESGRWAEADEVFALVADAEVARYGRGLSWQAAGKFERAKALVCDAGLSARLDALCDDLRVSVFYRAWEAHDIDATMALGRVIEQRGPISPDVSEIMAWALLEVGDYDQAAARFQSLVGSAMHTGLEPGVVRSFERAGRQRELDQLAESSPSLAQYLREQRATRAFARGQYGLYQTLSEPEQTDSRQWTLSTGLDASGSRGTHGLDHAGMGRTHVGLSSVRDGLQVDLGMRRSRFDGGKPTSDAALGFRGQDGGNDAFSPHRTANIDEWLLRLRREQLDYTLEAEIGSGPRGGAVDGRPTFGASATWFTESTTTRIALIGEARQDSLLAFAGQRDPVSGRHWGAVQETRIELNPYVATGEHQGVSFNIEHGWLDGRHVPSNQRSAMRIDYSHDLRPEDGGYHLRTGPFVSWTRYQHNLNHHTFGHGGYYSPERDVRIGLQFDALTGNNRNWLAQLRGAAAWGNVREAAAPRFPGQHLTGEDYAQSRTTGVGGDAEFRAAWRVSPHLVVNINAGVASAPRFDHWWVGAGLQMPLKTRHRLRPDDLYGVFDRR
ncbi:cellulose synthase subunit BcsC-related outer membrane protein [Ectothiorhodospira magna]|nr:cellulose synthase subunit BcsC-related outer membrane protein [Ectothiorhodospira magna]